ncbi:BTB/POZ domain-containing protein [Cordyceps javanica]|uniref:BTB/POZ domain-containing protein n=1 Tax=Cordyceps javanica TaxID=43265 RepID=A0A545VH48_9HYPO|nr:BTB/POZ domain-containing protein [Cordyceps javanica]
MSAVTRGPVFGHVLKTGLYSDLTLSCSRREFSVHRVVVCSQSEVLAAAIREPFQEAKTRTIVIEQYDADTVEKMVEFLYTGDYGSPLHEAQETNDASVAGSTASDDDLLQHISLNSIADYYGIKALAELSKAKLQQASENASNKASLLDAAKEALGQTGDLTLHAMLAKLTAKNIRQYLETDQLAELVGNFGIEILRDIVAAEDTMRSNITHLQFELEAERARHEGAKARSTRIVENINNCMNTLKESEGCRNQSCRAKFNCYIEERGQSFEPLFLLRCSECRCRH